MLTNNILPNMILQPISKQEAKKVKEAIRKINDWNLTFTDHINQKMNEKNFAARDVINVLLNGRLKKKREFDEENKGWKYTIVGRDIEKEKLTIVFTIIETEKLLILITGFRG